jgi:hypothetical protein
MVYDFKVCIKMAIIKRCGLENCDIMGVGREK